MKSLSSPALASVFPARDYAEHESQTPVGPFTGSEVVSLVAYGSRANMNRAPPPARGFGSNKTYLFKQTFLI
ncbi:MAG TPA: hypothetical protein V6D17_20895 [Candidatus Obscuribacterales bacterium]